MGVFQKMAQALESKFLRADEIVHAQGTGGGFGPLIFFDFLDQLREDERSLESRIGDGTNSDVLMSTIRWIQRAAVEAPIVALNDEGEPEPDSDLQALFDQPNEFYTRAHLVTALVFDLATSGNAYVLPGTDGDGRVTELWWAPSFSIEPKWEDAEPTVFIDHYLYQSGSAPEKRLDPKDVLHFRFGVDPRNTRKGLPPLRGLLREIATDDEASAFTAALLKNGGVPGLVISPTSVDAELPQEEIEAAVSRLEAKFSGNRRGKVLGLTGPVNVEQFGFSPQQMDLSVLRDVSEERITAALGIPAAVVGFGAGLQTAKVGATMGELIQMAHNNGVIPLQRIIEDTVNQHLSPSFGEGMHIEFDLTQVHALQEDRDAIANRVDRLVRSGIITRKMALTELGFEAQDSDDVYLLQLSTVVVPRGTTRVELEPEEESEDEQDDEEVVEADLEQLRRITAGERKTHSLIEQAIIERSPRVRRIPRRVRQFVRQLDRIHREAPAILEGDLRRIFDRLGEEAEQVTLRLLEERGQLGQRSRTALETKQDGELMEAILSELDLFGVEEELRGVYAAFYLAIASQVAEQLGKAMSIEFVLSDPVQSEILRQGGLRVGLLDLDAKTREALFDALAEARSEGLAGDNLARRIRERITAGPWRDVATRARVIARTEGANAANTATLRAAREMAETEHVLVTDNRTGFDDPDCIAANGRVVTVREAEDMGLAHPNCTRAFTPVNSLLLEELDLETVDGGQRLSEPV